MRNCRSVSARYRLATPFAQLSDWFITSHTGRPTPCSAQTIDMAQSAASTSRVTAVVSLPLSASVVIVLAFDGGGWGFFDWVDRSGRPLGGAPTGDDRARRFDSPHRALAFFRAGYVGSLLRKAPAAGDPGAGQVPAAPTSRPAADRSAEQAARVLIIDDSDDDAMQMDRLLYKSGLLADCVRVDTDDTIAAALADERGWDIILCDYRIPRLDAAQVLHTVRSALPIVPILLVCGHYPFDLWHELGSGVVRKFLSKDRLAELPQLVRALLDEHSGSPAAEDSDRTSAASPPMPAQLAGAGGS